MKLKEGTNLVVVDYSDGSVTFIQLSPDQIRQIEDSTDSDSIIDQILLEMGYRSSDIEFMYCNNIQVNGL